MDPQGSPCLADRPPAPRAGARRAGLRITPWTVPTTSRHGSRGWRAISSIVRRRSRYRSSKRKARRFWSSRSTRGRWGASSDGRAGPLRRSGPSWTSPERSTDGITNLKSSNSDRQEEIRGVRSEIDRPVLVATRLTLRGAGGRLTATLVPEGIDQLKDRSWVLIGGGAGPRRRYGIEEYSSYARKVVLKLKGVESAREAEAVVGQEIFLPCN